MTSRSIWFRKVALSACSLLLAGTVLAQAPAAPQSSRESALEKIFAAGLNSLRLVLVGIGSLGGGTESTGVVWRVDIRNGEDRRLGIAGGFVWPVPSPNGLAVFALRDRQVVRIAVSDGSETLVGAPAEWRKLIGVAPDGTVLGFVEDDPRPRPALLEPGGGGRLVELPAPADEGERKRNGLMLQDARDYADGVRLEVRNSERGGRGRDIFLVEGPKQRNLSNCGDDLCSQPSRSIDGNYVFFIRASRP
jgi:hypothetical protein